MIKDNQSNIKPNTDDKLSDQDAVLCEKIKEKEKIEKILIQYLNELIIEKVGYNELFEFLKSNEASEIVDHFKVKALPLKLKKLINLIQNDQTLKS